MDGQIMWLENTKLGQKNLRNLNFNLRKIL